MSNRVFDLFMRNPIAWALLGILAVTLLGGYQRGKDLDTVCEAIPWPAFTRDHPLDALEAAQAICVARNSN